jgi:hypothetical protein
MHCRTVGELIAKCYTLSLEDFLETYRDPMLIGVGILDAALLCHRDHRHSTLALGIESVTDPQQTRHHLMGLIIPITSKDGVAWVRLSIGRTEHSDLTIDDPAVSEVHGYIKRRGGGLVLGDLGSTNGTKVNGIPLKPPQVHDLDDEDILTFGRCSFQYFSPAALYAYLALGPT